MKIADSTVQLSSQQTSLSKNQTKESLTVWQTGKEPRTVTADGNDRQGLNSLKKKISLPSVSVALSSDARKAQKVKTDSLQSSGSGDPVKDLNLRILQVIIERLTGRKIRTVDLQKIMGEADNPATDPSNTKGGTQPVPSGNSGQDPGFGLIYESHQMHYESETVNFSAQGKVVTQDGQEIDFSTQLTMHQESTTSVDQTIRMGEALKDPLVVNFNGTAAQLTQTNFSFDLNGDGKNEQIAFPTAGSGFLALDKNGNNKIDNGSELFGPGTGNGFAELSAYDSDGNNWIDENDPVFSKLQILTKDASGNDNLTSLSQAGIGALYLGKVNTSFALAGADNNTAGQIRSTGVFVRENGSVGTLQQVDLVA